MTIRYTSILQSIFQSKRSSYLAGVTILALSVRLAVIVFVCLQQHILQGPQQARMYEHGTIAHNLYTGHGFAMQWPYESTDSARAAKMAQPPQWEGAFLPPANPYLLLLFYRVFGETGTGVLAIMLLSVLINSLLPLAIFRVGMQLGSEHAARVSAIVSALFFPAAYSVATFSGSAIYQLIGVMVLYYAIESAERPSRRSYFWLGVLCGLMTQFRSEFFAFGFVLIGLSALLALWKKRGQYVLRQAFGAVVVCAAILAPWTARNYLLFHQFIPVLSHPWYEIWRGENKLATGTSLNDEGGSVWVSASNYPDLVRRMDSIPYDRFFEVRVDRLFKEDALAFISSHPARFFSLGALKLWYLFTIDPRCPESPNPLYWGPMLIVSALTLLGLFRLLRDRDRRATAIILLAFLLFYLAGTFITIMLPRYQLYVFACLGGVTGLGLTPDRRSRSTVPVSDL